MLRRTKGSVGAKGQKGRDGAAGTNEQFRNFISIEGNTGVLDVQVESPIDTEISIRLYDETETERLDIFLSLDGEITINSGDVDLVVSDTALFYDTTSAQLHGSLTISESLEGWKL